MTICILITFATLKVWGAKNESLAQFNLIKMGWVKANSTNL